MNLEKLHVIAARFSVGQVLVRRCAGIECLDTLMTPDRRHCK